MSSLHASTHSLRWLCQASLAVGLGGADSQESVRRGHANETRRAGREKKAILLLLLLLLMVMMMWCFLNLGTAHAEGSALGWNGLHGVLPYAAEGHALRV